MSAGNSQASILRGYQKIEGAARTFNFDFRNKTVLDIGSSTGGFTAYALDSGATKVIAVEKGTNQMQRPLRYDERIDLHEKTDIFTFKPAKRPDVIVGDISFLSLTKILSYARLHLATRGTDFLVMLKPQFEARPSDLTRGVVKNETIRRRIIKDFEFWLKSHHYVIIKKHDNDLKGKTGNRERFYWLRIV